jgi:predicted HicB family RNase H-like nuclease
MNKECTVNIRLPQQLRNAMAKEAKRRGLSLSAWLRMIAIEEIDRRKK